MLTKAQLISTLDKLPESMTIDQLVDYLLFVEKVEKGLVDSAANRVHSKEDAAQKLNKWLK